MSLLTKVLMPMAEFSLTRLKPGSKQGFALEAFRTPAGSVTIPLLAIRGRQEGPVLMAVAGVHGDEFEGMAAIRQVFSQLDPDTFAGTFLAIPVCNVFAYEGLSRTSPLHVDGLNMARIFPGDRNGDPTSRLAFHLHELVLRLLTLNDLFVDFHSSGTRYQYMPMIGFVDTPGPARIRSEEAARRFGIDLVWALTPETHGRFNTQTTLGGIPTLGTEIFGNGGCRDEDVAVYANGLVNLLRFQGMLEGDAPRQVAQAARFTTLRVGESGFFAPVAGVALGARIQEGALLARLLDPWGEENGRVVAPATGRIVAIRTYSTIWTGDIAFLIQPEKGEG